MNGDNVLEITRLILEAIQIIRAGTLQGVEYQRSVEICLYSGLRTVIKRGMLPFWVVNFRSCRHLLMMEGIRS